MNTYFNHTSERLLYRKLTTDDIPSWENFFVDNDRLHFLAFPEGIKSHKELSTEWIDRQLQRYEESGLGMLGVVLKENNELIGLCGIINREFEEKTIFEIGYSFMREHWGNGYATEAARQMKKIGMELGVSDKFVSMIHPDNCDSIKVAERNEMFPLKQSIYMDMDVIIYGDEGAI